MAKLSDKRRFAEIEKFGEKLIHEIGAVIPAVPVALVSTVILRNNNIAMGELELKSKVFALITDLEKRGAYTHIPREDRDYAVSTGLRMLTLRHIVQMDADGTYKANPTETILLEYYANSIAHLL